jgi:hypothetical protein
MMLNARRDNCLRHRDNNGRLDGTMHHLCLFFEEVGAFCSKGVLDIDVVWEIYSFEIEHYWVMARDSITKFKRDQKDDTFYYHFKRLYQSTQKLGRKKGAPDHEKTREDIDSFIELELRKIEFFLNADDPRTAQKARNAAGDVLAERR